MPDQSITVEDQTLADDLALDRIIFNPATDAPLFEHRARPQPELRPIPWPEGLAPVPRYKHGDPRPDPAAVLPQADVLIVTYTVAEGFALADVLTPGVPSSDWFRDENGWPDIKALIEGERAPALKSECAGLWMTTKIGDVTAVLIKSNLHPATDGPKVPILAAWQKWIDQVKPKLILTTGTAGAVQADTLLGDVVISNDVVWNCTRQFKNQPFATKRYASTAKTNADWLANATQLLNVNAAQLPAATRTAQIRLGASVITTDRFAFDDAEDSYGLRAFDPNARAVEMDDAACAEAAGKIPWLSVRNASDPQMDNPDPAQEARLAAGIYQRWGRVTSWGSAMACWGIATNLDKALA